MADEYRFQVVGTSHTGNQAFIEAWEVATGGRWSIGSWEDRVVLVHVPMPTLNLVIQDSEEKVIAQAGDSISSVLQKIDPEEPYYLWDGKMTPTQKVLDNLQSFLSAIQIALHINGERRLVGWIPAKISNDICNEIDEFYPYSAEATHGQLRVTIKRRKRTPAVGIRIPS